MTGEPSRSIAAMSLHQAAVIGAIIYFVGFGAVFLARPGTVERLGLAWTDAAGQTEVRAYYGGLSWALAGFLTYLLTQDLDLEALTGVLILASAVLVTRVIGATIDRGWAEIYNRQAIPIEAAFALGLLVCRALG